MKYAMVSALNESRVALLTAKGLFSWKQAAFHQELYTALLLLSYSSKN